MDDNQFDSLTKAFVEKTRDRRTFFQVAAVGGVAGILGTLGFVDTEAKKKKKCKKGTVKCGKKCCPKTCVSQSTCGTNCKCFFDVKDALACYDLSSQGTCCDSAAECASREGCVKGACNGGGKAGACFSLCGR